MSPERRGIARLEECLRVLSEHGRKMFIELIDFGRWESITPSLGRCFSQAFSRIVFFGDLTSQLFELWASWACWSMPTSALLYGCMCQSATNGKPLNRCFSPYLNHIPVQFGIHKTDLRLSDYSLCWYYPAWDDFWMWTTLRGFIDVLPIFGRFEFIIFTSG